VAKDRAEPANEADCLDDALSANLGALDLLADSGLLDGVRRAAISAGAEAEEQSPARDRLKRRRHVGQDSRLAIGHIEHERLERNSACDLGQRRQHRPRFRDSWHAGRAVGITYCR